jgi:ATP-dependent protease HslVU (ClpYQ) peptidase subunit
MTCVVALEHKGTIYIGADSAGVDANSLAIVGRADEKVFITDDGDYIMGFAGSFRIGQLLRYALVAPDQPGRKDDMAFMVTDFIDAVRAMQHEKGAREKKDELELHEGQFIVGYRGHLYVVECDYQVGRPIDNYAAIGCGADLALGAMYATKMMEMKPEERLTLALHAAQEFSAGVRAPFVILKRDADVIEE